jgi:phosphatidylglycerophosphate synthase
LLKTLFKPTDGIISRAFNRHVSLRVSRTLLETSITPNQMTLVAAVFGLAGIWIVLAQGMAGLIPGAILIQIQSILDGCDGELSRLKFLRSKVGEWLDQVFDDLVNLGYFVAVGWTLYQAGSALAGWATLVGGVGHVVYQVSLYTGLLTRGGGSGSVASIVWWGQRAANSPGTPASTDPIGRIKELIEMAGQRDFFTILYLPAAVLGISIVALCWCAFVFAGTGAMTGVQWLVAGGPKKA